MFILKCETKGSGHTHCNAKERPESCSGVIEGGGNDIYSKPSI